MSAVPSTDGAGRAADEPFNARVMIWVVVAAVVAVIAFLFLSTYAPEMRDGNNGAAHALSKSAIGYSALIKLETELGHNPQLVRTDEELNTNGLLVLTPEIDEDPDALAKIVTARESAQLVTLVVLPKHEVVRQKAHPGWVDNGGLVSDKMLSKMLSGLGDFKITRAWSSAADKWPDRSAPVPLFRNYELQSIAGEVNSLLSDDRQQILLGKVKPSTFILAEPDVLNNLGLADRYRAFEADRILMFLAQNQASVLFDVTRNGFGHGRGLLDLILRPPFLALTICVLVAAILALLNGLLRFGPPMVEAHAIPGGKRALVCNTADLLKMTRRDHQLGGRYAALIRSLAAAQSGLPLAMDADAITARLDALKKPGRRFSDLAYQAEYADNRAALLDAAQQLDAWRRRN